MPISIETRRLTHYYGARCAVEDLSLSVEAGTFYGLLGPNGAGKSTTIKILTGLLAPSLGSVHIFGEDMLDEQKTREIRSRVGVVPEQSVLFDHLTAREYLLFVGRMYRLPLETVRDRCEELLVMMNLQNENKKYTLKYSHGMKKKLALAAALIANPDLLFLDEPFGGVDAVSSRIIRDTLNCCVARGVTVFLTSHILEIVEKLCTEVGIINIGTLVYQSSMEKIRQEGSLEQRFLETIGNNSIETQELSWLKE